MKNYLAFVFNLERNQLLQEMCYRRFRFFEKTLLVLLSVSILIAVLEENYYFEANFSASLNEEGYSLSTNFKNSEPQSSTTLRDSNLVLMLMILINLYLRKRAYFVFMKSISAIEFSQHFMTSQAFFRLCIESGLICIQTYPQVQGSYSSSQRQWEVIYLNDTILTFLTLLIRVGMVIRSCIYMTKFSSPKSIKICSDNGVAGGFLYSMKAEFHNHLKLFVSVFLALLIVNNGILLRLCERSAELLRHQDWDYVWNSFWCVIVCMTTVGYGDIVPATDNGRVVVGFTSIMGSLVTSMICIIFLMEFSFDRNQENAYERIKATECTMKLEHSAANCIGLAVRYKLRLKKAKESEKGQLIDEFFVDIKEKVKDFRTWKKTIIEFKHNKKIERRITSVDADFNNRLDELGLYMTYYDFVKTKLGSILRNQKEIDKHLSLMENVHQNFIIGLDFFSEDQLVNMKNYTKTKGIERKPGVIGSLKNVQLPKIQLESLDNDFTLFTKTKSRSSLLKSTDDKKIRNFTKTLEKHLSIRKPRKSFITILPILEMEESVKKPKINNFSESPKKDKKIAIISKKKASIKENKGKNINRKSILEENTKPKYEKNENSLSSSLESRKGYPSFDSISNHEIKNFLNDSGLFKGKIDELEEGKECERKEDENHKQNE